MPITLTYLENFAKDTNEGKKLVLDGDFETKHFTMFGFPPKESINSFYTLLQCALAKNVDHTSEVAFNSTSKGLVSNVMKVFQKPLVGRRYQGGFEINCLSDDAVKTFFDMFPHHVHQLCLGNLTNNMWTIIKRKLDKAAFTHIELRLKENCSFTDAQSKYVELHNQARNQPQITEASGSTSEQATPEWKHNQTRNPLQIIEVSESTSEQTTLKRKHETIDYVTQSKRSRKKEDAIEESTVTADGSESLLI